MVFEIICGPGLSKFFQAEYFIALASLDMNGIFMVIFGCSNKEGKFGNTGMILSLGVVHLFL